MNKEQGLTLIELLITIAVIAIVAAISVPAITNVINDSEQRALAQANFDVDAKISKLVPSGAVLFYSVDTEALGTTIPANTLVGFVDTNGNGSIEAGEQVSSYEVPSKYVLVDENQNPITIIQPNNFDYPVSGFLNTANINVLKR